MMLTRLAAALLAAALTGHAMIAAAAPNKPAKPAAAKAATPLATATPSRRAAETVMLPPGDAALSADGLRAAWATADKRSILSATRATPGTDWSVPNRLLTTRGVVHKIVFSPDGKSIAYENQRTWRDNGKPDDTWQFICVYDIATRQISYVDPSFDFDTDPKWVGEQISFTRKVDGIPDAHLTRPVTRLKLAAWTPPALRPGEHFTMAAVLAAPHIYPPTPSGDGTAIAYITREGKDRNVDFVRAGEPARILTTYGNDEGADMSDIVAVSKTGGAVAYVHGGRINGQGEAPNPTSLPDMPQQQVWIIGTQGKDAPRLLGPGKDVVFTPDGHFILWRSAGKIMGAALTWDNDRLLGVGDPKEFLTGLRAGMRFSPDGGKLAYEARDGIEIYDFASKTTALIPHGKDVDLGPVWSPDGAHLAFRREPANAPDLSRNNCGLYRYCGAVVEAQPWAIWTVDIANPTAPHQVWQAKAGQGSVFYAMDQSYSPGGHEDQMFWSPDNRIAFSWEGDGWRHLYAIPAAGGAAKLLTPGDGEVETSALSIDGSGIVYATNIGDLGRRHIARVSFDGKVTTMTSGEADQWAPIPMADNNVAYIDAGWSIPEHVVIQSAGGARKTAEFPAPPADYPSAMLVKPSLVDFPSSDGQISHGQLFVPDHPNGCAIIFSHGGIRRQMLPGFHYMDAYTYLYEMNQYLASRGCVVLSVEYRSSIMRGEAYRNAPGWGYAGNSELLDFVGAATYLKKRKDVDAKRGIGVYGLSWGGYMTSELLSQHSDIFSVGFDMAGVHTGGDATGFPYSAIGHIDSWTSPVFLAQGDDDMNVAFNEGTALARALQTKRPMVEFKQQVLPGQTHDLYLTYEQLAQIYGDGSYWLLAHLGVK